MKKGRNSTEDQSEEEADGKSGMLLQKKGQQIGHAKKANPISEKNRKQNRKMGFQTGDRISSEFHDGLIDAEHNA